MDTYTLLPALAVTFVVTVAVMLALHPLAKKIGLVDRPGGRKKHEGTVPLIGGLAMFIAMVVGESLISPPTLGFASALVAGALLIIIGVIDDAIALPTITRIITQVSVALIMIYGAGHQLADIGDPFGTGVILMGGATVIFTVVVCVTLINSYNLVDGLDGLAGSLAAIALLSVAIVAGTDSIFRPAALVAVAAIAGFLVFNLPVSWNRSVRAFMGDAGSTLLGFVIVWATLGVAQGAERVISPVHCLWFAAIPVFDCLSCFVCRILKKKSPFTPGRDHFHHSLRRGGFGIRSTVEVLVGFQLVYATIGLMGHFTGVPDVVMFAGWSVAGLSQRWLIRKIAKTHRHYLMSLARSRQFEKQNETART
jgi:UDP-GlcNAc:undecaprenyl-phosphate GlcNAc-1-phosphate transferase